MFGTLPHQRSRVRFAWGVIDSDFGDGALGRQRGSGEAVVAILGRDRPLMFGIGAVNAVKRKKKILLGFLVLQASSMRTCIQAHTIRNPL